VQAIGGTREEDSPCPRVVRSFAPTPFIDGQAYADNEHNDTSAYKFHTRTLQTLLP